MQRKSIFTILGVMLAVVVTSLALVFTVGPKVSADSVEPLILEDEGDFIISSDGVLSGFTHSAYEKISSRFSDNRSGAFTWHNNDGVIHVVIPETVTCVGNGIYGIFQCDNYTFGSLVTEIILPNNLMRIGNRAFDSYYECRITSIVIPINVSIVGSDVFAGCRYSLETIYCECSEEFAQSNWDENWKGDCDAEVVWDYNANNNQSGSENQNENTNNENQNQENNQHNDTATNEVASAEKKNNPLMAWIGGGIAAGLSVICGAAIVVAKKRRK